MTDIKCVLESINDNFNVLIKCDWLEVCFGSNWWQISKICWTVTDKKWFWTCLSSLRSDATKVIDWNSVLEAIDDDFKDLWNWMSLLEASDERLIRICFDLAEAV